MKTKDFAEIFFLGGGFAIKFPPTEQLIGYQVVLVPVTVYLDSSLLIVEDRLSMFAPQLSERRVHRHLLDGKTVGVGQEESPQLEIAVADVASHLKKEEFF